MLPSSSSLSGHTIRYRTIPYRFPACVRVDGLGPISDALVGRKWTEYEVQRDVAILFGDDYHATKQYVDNWRFKVLERVRELWETVKEAEKLYYGENSL